MSNSEVTCLANCCDRYIDVSHPSPFANELSIPFARAEPARLPPRSAQATKVVVGTVAAVNKAASQEQGFGGGLH